jgi:uracil-DNA glycosylase family 4
MPTFPDPDTRNVLEGGCSRCPALTDCRTEISWGNGPRDASVMVVGEAPAAGNPDAERWQGGNLTGLAYTSRHSGRLVRDLFEELGYDPYFTNAVKCYPSDGEGSNREPTAGELANCREHLRTEIEGVNPGVVVPTGKYATETVLAFESVGLDGFLDSVLEPTRCKSLGVALVPILHPSYQNIWLARLGYEYEEYVEELGSCIDACLEKSEGNAV